MIRDRFNGVQTSSIQNIYNVFNDTDLTYQILYQAFPNHHKIIYQGYVQKNFNHLDNYNRVLQQFKEGQVHRPRFAAGFGAPK